MLIVSSYFGAPKSLEGWAFRISLLGVIATAIFGFSTFSDGIKLTLGVIALVLTVFVRIPDQQRAKTHEIIEAMKKVMVRKQVWSVHWRIVMYRLGYPGDDKLIAVAIFARGDVLPKISGWQIFNWPSNRWMPTYVMQIIRQHMGDKGWSLKDNPCYLYRDWSNKTSEKHIAAEILEVCGKMNIPMDEIDVVKIGELSKN